MKFVRHLFTLTAFFITVLASAQESAVIRAYINTYREIAIAEMQRTGVPAAIKLAQGIHETMAGTSVLVQKSNNHFGIKCKANWTGESVSHTDDAPNECFRKYPEAAQSYRDHSDFLRANARYASLFNLDPTDYRGWAYGLKKAGYATNPKYPQVIIRLVEDYNLQDYTMIALGKQPPLEPVVAALNEPVPELVPEPVAVKPRADYPSGEFKINDTRVVYAAAGVSYLALAKEHHVPLKRLFEYNDLEETEVVLHDQLVYLQRKRKNGNSEFHVVAPGESLQDIAQAEAIRLESLLEYNMLRRDMLPAAGEKLYLRGKAPQTPKLAGLPTIQKPQIPDGDANISAGSKLVRYTVGKKETLYAIARKHEVTVDEIRNWNSLDSNNLREGQQLKIYK